MNIRPYLIALGLASAVLAAGCNRTPDNASTDTSDMSSTTQNAVDETKDAGHSVADEAKQAANTVGEKVDDLRPFDPREVARAIAGLPPE